VAVPEPPPPNADSDIVAGWDAVELLSHLVADDSPEGLARRAERSAELHATGKLARNVRREPPLALANALGPEFLKAVPDASSAPGRRPPARPQNRGRRPARPSAPGRRASCRLGAL
jgi:hypothetical protein